MTSRRQLPVILLLAGVALAGIGCIDSVESDTLETEGLYADFSANARGSQEVTIEAGLKTEGRSSKTYANLSDGDALTFYVDGHPHEPEPDKSFGTEYAYTETVSQGARQTNIRIDFERANGTDAPNSTVTLPERFQIEAPDRNDTFSRSLDDIWVKIDGASPEATMYLSVEGHCLEEDYENDFVGRSITIPHEELESDDHDDEERCRVDLTVERRVRGSVDDNYEGGEFTAKQVRETSFRSVL